DPLVEYKKESFRMFNEFMAMVEKQVVYSLFKMSVIAQRPQAVQPAKSLLDQGGLKLSGARKSADGGVTESGAGATGDKIGRNDPCPCGATKDDGTPVKYKKCHGKEK
ncbi:TPA: preprotein translocase subunit SecA, partial [Candidatus Uhrbacteria bacterium]|nr:preprotein translocase subunit SecA [Candidatus Uhrbacteria bacterium]